MTEMIEERPPDRGPTVRRVMLYAPMTAAVLTLFVISFSSLFGGNGGATIPAVLLGLLCFAVSFELISSLRDLRSEPVVVEGTADRIWRKSKFLFFGRQNFVLVNRKVFEVGVIAATELQLGQRVSICHWPHTMRVITLERIADDAPDR
jgi:hypothetical protein